MSSARRAAVLPLAIAVGGVLLASAPAYATVKATWSKPTDNSTYTTTAPIDFAVTLDRGLVSDGAGVNLNLAVPGPNPGPFKVDAASGSDKDLKFTFAPGCPNHAGSCASGSPSAYNGRYTATLTGAVTGARTVVLQIPPAAPADTAAVATGQHRIKVSWSPNREPDLTGYDVFTDEGVTVASALPTTATSYEFELPSSGYGGEHTYLVRASRLACANCSGPEAGAQIYSQASQASVTLSEPTPDPGTDPGDGSTDPGTDPGSDPDPGADPGYNGGNGNGNGNGGSKGNGTSGNGSSGTGTTTDENGYNTGTSTGGEFSSGQSRTEATRAAQQKLAFGLTFKSFAPKLGAPKLPPLPEFAPPKEEALPWGTYDPTLNYGDQTVLDSETVASGGGLTDTIYDTFSTAFEGQRLFRSIAIALLMLLAAGHLRLWLRNTPTP